MNSSIKFGLSSLIIFFIAVNSSFSDLVSGALIISSLLLAVAGVISGIKTIPKNKNKTVYLGMLACCIILILFLGIMVYGHFVLYGKIGIVNFNT
jgi:hypothetical protein